MTAPVVGPSAAVAATHEWFDRNSGWAPPDPGTLAEWLADGVCRCPDECLVAPAASCPHGLASWWLVLRTLDGPDRADPLPPPLLAPAPSRLDPSSAGYVAALDAHHEAVVADRPTYRDPPTGYEVLTARTLWQRGTCCQQGCRHCPWTPR